jgi:hypothetical protein
MAAATKSKKRVVTDEHKAAMAAGRAEARAVKNYLDALEMTRPRRGRKRTPESVNQRLMKVSAELETTTDPMKRLNLTQERIDLEKELAALESKVDIDMDELEKAFIAAAKSYSARKGITYAAWREVGVPAATLKAAGISRSS